MSNIYKEWGKIYLDKNYSTIPDIGGSKQPAIKEWTTFCRRKPTEEEIESWGRNFKNTGISICLGEASGVVCIDVDVSEPTLLEKIIEFLPESPVAKFGSKGITRFYKYTGSERTKVLKVNGNTAIELLADGKKTTLPPSIHEKTGQPYTWIGKSLLEIEYDELPILPEPTIERLAFLLKGESKDFIIDGTHVTVGRNNTLGSYAAKLIKDRVPMDEAIALLISRDSETSETPLFSDLKEFPHTEIYTNALTFYSRFLNSINTKHFSNNEYYEVPVTLSAVTKEMGEQAMLGKSLNLGSIKSLHTPGLSRVPAASTSSTTPLPVAQGALKNLIDNILVNSYIPQPEFAYAAAFTVIATVIGRKVIFENLSPNLYTMCIGSSGTGKDAPLQMSKKFMLNCGAESLLGSGNYVSDAALMDSLGIKPSRLDVVDEASGLLGAATRGGNTYDTKMADILCELYTSSNSKFMGRVLGDSKGEMKVRGSCFRPNVSLLCATTQAGFSSSLSSKALEKGLLGRFLIFTGEKGKSRRVPYPIPLDGETNSILNFWFKYEPKEYKEMQIGHVIQDVTVLTSTEEANKRLNEIFEEFDTARYEADESDALNPVRARMYQQMIKIIMIHACGRVFQEVPVINIDDVDFGYKMIHHIFITMQKLLKRGLHSNKNEMVSNKVLALIEDSGITGMSKNELTYKTKALTKKEREDAVQDLVEAEQISLNMEVVNGARVLIYRSVQNV